MQVREVFRQAIWWRPVSEWGHVFSVAYYQTPKSKPLSVSFVFRITYLDSLHIIVLFLSLSRLSLSSADLGLLYRMDVAHNIMKGREIRVPDTI